MRLHPEFGDDLSKILSEPHPELPRVRMIAHKDNGDCVYLERGKGCAIHDRAPYKCRTMDCRNVFRRLSAIDAVRLHNQGAITMDVWRRGRELALTPPPQNPLKPEPRPKSVNLSRVK